MPAATDSAQNNWIVILCVSSANRSKQTTRKNLNKKNHYAAAVSNPAGDRGWGPWMSVSLGSIVRRQVEISMMGRSLIQRSPTDYGVFECDRGTSQRRPGHTRAVEP